MVFWKFYSTTLSSPLPSLFRRYHNGIKSASSLKRQLFTDGRRVESKQIILP
jgi:hypothetical protein